jgi:hypothetical protein
VKFNPFKNCYKFSWTLKITCFFAEKNFYAWHKDHAKQIEYSSNSAGLRISPIKVLNFIKKQKFVAVIQSVVEKIKK